jgi:GTP-binding protein HflX
MDLLRPAIADALALRHVIGEVRLPSSAARLRARLHELEAIRGEEVDEHGWILQVDLAIADLQRLFAQAHGEALRPLLEQDEHTQALLEDGQVPT